MTSKELEAKRTADIAAADAIFNKAKAESRSMTADEVKTFDAKMNEADAALPLITEAQAREAQDAIDAEKRAKRLEQAQSRMATPANPASNRATNPNAESRAERRDRVLETAPIWGSLKNFSNDAEGRYKAWQFGNFCLAIMGAPIGKGQRAMRACKEHGVELRIDNDMSHEERALQQENVNYLGGYLVPDQFVNDLIVLREKFGVFPQYAKIIPMKGDTSTRPRRRGGLTASFVGEGSAGTASTMPFDAVSLQAKKIMALSLYSNELNEDAVINIGDTLAGECAYAFAQLIDKCGFIGDGSSTYGGINGLHGAFTALAAGTISNVPNIKQSTGGSWALTTGIAIADVLALLANLPQYADTPNTAWYCHKTFFHQVLQGLATVVPGGTRKEDLTTKMDQMFLGYPVRFTQTMPNAYVTKTFPLYFGDLSLGVDFGDRRQTTLAFSNQATVGSVNSFASDVLAVRATQRFDIKVHDIGYNKSVTPTGILQVNGPITALYTA